jgi:hypothetical protein
MFIRGTTVTASTVVAIRTTSGLDSVLAHVRYDITDPYAVTVAFQVGHDQSLDWVFGRDLLAEGLAGAAGDGDVRICRAADDPTVLIFELDSPFGRAVIEGVAADFAEFLDRTYTEVAPGTETRFLNLDETVDRLLTSGAW